MFSLILLAVRGRAAATVVVPSSANYLLIKAIVMLQLRVSVASLTSYFCQEQLATMVALRQQ